MVGVLRMPLRAPRTALQPCTAFRSLSTSAIRSSLLHQSPLLRAALRHTPTPTPVRTLSLASIFAPRKPASVPPPQVVANIAAIEAAADANPHDVEKQTALFEALLATKVKAGYDVLISRWERMCEFVSILGFSTVRISHNCLVRIPRVLSCAPMARSNSI